MGFIYFAAVVILVLIGYYIYLIKQEGSPKPSIFSQAPIDSIEYEFTDPIKVSEEYILGAREYAPTEEAQTSSSITPEIGATTSPSPEEENKEEQEGRLVTPAAEENTNNKPQLTSSGSDLLIHHLIDFTLAKKQGYELSKLVPQTVYPSVATVASAETEFFHLSSSEYQGHIKSGRQMFADIPLK